MTFNEQAMQKFQQTLRDANTGPLWTAVVRSDLISIFKGSNFENEVLNDFAPLGKRLCLDNVTKLLAFANLAMLNKSLEAAVVYLQLMGSSKEDTYNAIESSFEQLPDSKPEVTEVFTNSMRTKLMARGFQL